MHRAKLTSVLKMCWDAPWVVSAPSGRSFLQALSAAWNWELLTPSSCELTLGNPSGIALLALASGNLGTPFERMQREKASASFSCDGEAAGGFEEDLL
jgi:hypothetical protein